VNAADATDGPAVGLGNIALKSSMMNMTGGTLTAATSGSRNAGNITVTARQDVNLTNKSSVTASSTGSGSAGNIKLEAGNSLLLSNSIVSSDATATTALGGDVKLKASFMVQLVDSTIKTSVQGGTATVGGNISIDPQFVVIQGSNILTTATFGTGGTITIIGNVVLIDPTSVLDVSSLSGGSGSIDIRSPVSNISGLIGRLPESVLEAQELLRAACAARLAEAQASSFVERGRDGIPAGPDGLLATPFLPPGPETPQTGASLLEPSGSSRTASPQASDVHVRRLLGADSVPRAQFLLDDSACRS
ncbi:MAG: hypothetical protein ACRDZ4_09085, partial [Egibacteraceae bacterium]